MFDDLAVRTAHWLATVSPIDQKRAGRMQRVRHGRAAHVLTAAAVTLLLIVHARVEASLDSGFGSGPNPGVVQIDSTTGAATGRAVLGLPDGSIVAAWGQGVLKYTATGILDTSFGGPGTPGVLQLDGVVPTSLSLDSNGMVVVTGSRNGVGITPNEPVIVRLTQSGAIDAGFTGSIDPYAFRVSAPIELGANIVVSNFELDGTVCVHRLRASDGVLDPTFGPTASGHSCVTGLGQVTDVYGRHHFDGHYTIYVAIQTPGPADVAGSQIDIFDFSAAGIQQGSKRTIAAVAGEYLMSGQVSSDGALLVSGQRNGSVDGFVRRYVNEALDPTFATSNGTPGVASLPALRIERLEVLPDGRIVASGSVSFDQAQARLLTADGRPDAALQPDGDSPDRISLPYGSYGGWTPNSGTFADATLSNGRVVLIGTESERSGLSVLHNNPVLAASDALGPPAPITQTSPGSFLPVVPERLLDTRPDVQVGYTGTKPGAGATVRLKVTGVGTTQVPMNAKAVVLNVTGTEATADGFVTVWPCGAQRPLASNLNLVAGGTRPNVVVAGVGGGGEVCLFTQTGAHLIADIAGYFTASSAYVASVPGRVLDTRPDSQIAFVGAKPVAGRVIQLHVAGSGPHLAPPGTAGVVVNLTGTEADQGTYVTVYACGSSQPFVSSLNVSPGETVSNSVIAPVAADGTICLFTQNSAHLVVDISGWFPAGSSYGDVVPDRLLDTRVAISASGYVGPRSIAAGESIAVRVIGGRPNVPVDATAVILNVVGVDAPVGGFVTVWPCGATRPLASNLNLRPGAASASLVIAGIGANGSVCLFAQNGAHLIVDIFGYIAPR